MSVSRRNVLVGIPMLGLVGAAPAYARSGRRGVGSVSLPEQDPELVYGVVLEAHRSLDKVRELVSTHPELAKASMDWGFGDWESALGAAGHTGQRDIAIYLIEQGARPNIFTLAMLGHIDAVRAMVEAHPGVQRVAGPHGISLLRHARAGGEAAKPVVEYLQSLGDADPGYTNVAFDDAQREACVGSYSFGDSPEERFDIVAGRSGLRFKMEGTFGQNLFHQGDHEFHPGGAPSVRVKFEVQGGTATRVVIADGAPIAEATRI